MPSYAHLHIALCNNQCQTFTRDVTNRNASLLFPSHFPPFPFSCSFPLFPFPPFPVSICCSFSSHLFSFTSTASYSFDLSLSFFAFFPFILFPCLPFSMFTLSLLQFPFSVPYFLNPSSSPLSLALFIFNFIPLPFLFITFCYPSFYLVLSHVISSLRKGQKVRIPLEKVGWDLHGHDIRKSTRYLSITSYFKGRAGVSHFTAVLVLWFLSKTFFPIHSLHSRLLPIFCHRRSEVGWHATSFVTAQRC